MSSARPCVLVSHPGRQHSERLVSALRDSGIQTAYWCGSIAGRGTRATAGDAPHVPARRSFPAAPVLRRAFRVLGGRRGEQAGDYFGNRWFDLWAARRIEARAFDLVVGYEAGCARTFEAARRRGVRTLLDAASVHHNSQDRWRAPEDPRWLHRRIIAVKDREIRSADRILVASTVAAISYREAGVPEAALRVAPLGVDLETFRPRGRSEGSNFRLLFAGKPTRTKGFDLLLGAFDFLRQSGLDCSLRVAGQGQWEEPLPAEVEIGSVPHDRLAEVYSAVDLLVLPSRFDGFAMVVSEALACGTPVVVSDRVGAGDLVREGVNGWVVEADSVDRLRERLDWCIRHPEAVRALRPACRGSVERHGWDVYSRRVVEVVRELLDERRS